MNFLPGSETDSCCQACVDSVLWAPAQPRTVRPRLAGGRTPQPRTNDDVSVNPDGRRHKTTLIILLFEHYNKSYKAHCQECTVADDVPSRAEDRTFPVVVWQWLGERDCTAQYNCCLPATTDCRWFCCFVFLFFSFFLFNFIRCPAISLTW